jgi:hypothetical protein
MAKRIMGGIIILMGVSLLGWIGYNFLIERLPETQGRSPVVPFFVSMGMIYVGVKWVRGETAG